MTGKWLRISFIISIAILITCNEHTKKKIKKRKNQDYPEQNMWKKEYEEELTGAMVASKLRDNYTRPSPLAQHSLQDNEIVLEKLVESIASSEKYLKKIDGLDFKLNRLDTEVHEKTNSILKFITEISRMIRTNNSQKKVETMVEHLRSDLTFVKNTLELGNAPRTHQEAENIEFSSSNVDSNLNNKVSNMQQSLKTVMEGMDSILAILSEVKNRPYNRIRTKSELPGGMDALTLYNEIRRTMFEQRAKKCECKNGRVDRSERYPTDCNEIQMQGFNVSGIYKIKPDEYESFYVLCDLTTAGGGWTVIQNRFDGSQNFFKSWSDYKYGFGNLAGEFWMGLDKLHFLTTQKLYELRIEMETPHGHDAYAGYSVFSIGPEIEGYRISTLGTYYGTAGDSLSYHAGQKFSTPDVDNDEWKDGACSTEHGGAWWYKECDKSNLNGNYILNGNEETKLKSMYWISFKGPNTLLAKTRMLIRPLPASRPSDTNEVSRKILDQKSGPIIGTTRMAISDKKSINQHYRYDDQIQAESFYK